MSYKICVWRKHLAYNPVRFLFAYLYLNLLLNKRSKKKILSTLAKLLRGLEALDKANNNTIKRIEG